MFNRLNTLNIYIYSIAIGVATPLLGMTIAYSLVTFGSLTGLYSYSEKDIDIFDFSWVSIVLVAPLLESIIVLLLINFCRMFTLKEKNILIVAVVFALLHGLSNWISAFAVLPLFLISVKSFFYF